MNYFKNTNNEIFAYDDEQVEQGFGKDLISITEDEMKELTYVEPPKVKIITLRQAREQLIRDGLDDDVEAYINNISDTTQQKIARNYWEYSEVFEREHPTLLALASGLGLTDEQLDTMFEQASKL